MAIREILVEGDPLLRKTSKEVKNITPRIIDLLDDMAETMKLAEGMGLAAPQVGVLRRIVLVNVGEGVLELINPEIIDSEGSQLDSEGCLSMPGISGKVYRPETVRFRAMNRKGEVFQDYADGIKARCICHELDHLNGVLIRDRIIEYDKPEEE